MQCAAGQPGTNSFLEASSEISSIFGGGDSFGSSFASGAAARMGMEGGGIGDMYDKHQQSGMGVSAPVPVRARPPLAPGSRSSVVHAPDSRQALGGAGLGDALRVGGGARSASPHQIIRSPFDNAGAISIQRRLTFALEAGMRIEECMHACV